MNFHVCLSYKFKQVEGLGPWPVWVKVINSAYPDHANFSNNWEGSNHIPPPVQALICAPSRADWEEKVISRESLTGQGLDNTLGTLRGSFKPKMMKQRRQCRPANKGSPDWP